ncbi:MAG: Nitroreductase [Chloroflexi bacterium]|nr:MAG: Nitroreductase [Chloroflexota bacterium]
MTDADRLPMPLGEAMYSMRAIRRLKPDPIPDADLRTIIEAATQAPSGGNGQPWHYLLIRDPDQRAKLGALYHEAWWAKRRDAGIHGPDDIPESDRVTRSAMRLADEIGAAPVIVLLLATAHGAGAMGSVIPSVQNLLLAARALGVGGTITTLHADVDARVRALCEIPESMQIVYCLPLGYPRGRFGPLNRHPAASVTSLDRVGAATDWD